MKQNLVPIILVIITILVSGCTTLKEGQKVPEEKSAVEEIETEESVEAENPEAVQETEKLGAKITQKDAQKISEALDARLKDAYARLHTPGSGEKIRNDFRDIELTYTDSAENAGFPQFILPFRYYYSKEANKTFNICAIETSVFICDGKLSKLITKEDIDSGRCKATPIYLGDRRLGGTGSEGWTS